MRIGMGDLRGRSSASGLGDISTLAATVQKVEGYYPPGTPNYPTGSLAWRNNNPGNLRLAGQPGASQGEGGYAKFPSYSAGYQALLNQINYQATPGYRSPATGQVYPQGQNLSEFINTYAPAADSNNPSAYLATLVQATGYPADTLLSTVISGAAAPPTSTDPSTGGVDATDSTTVTDLTSTDTPAESQATTDMTPLLLAAIGAGLLWVFFGR